MFDCHAIIAARIFQIMNYLAAKQPIFCMLVYFPIVILFLYLFLYLFTYFVHVMYILYAVMTTMTPVI